MSHKNNKQSYFPKEIIPSKRKKNLENNQTIHGILSEWNIA